MIAAVATLLTLLNIFEQNLGAETFGKLLIEAVPLSNLAILCNRCLAVLNGQERGSWV